MNPGDRGITVSAAMKRAVQWLDEHGGSGILDFRARVLAGGVVAVHIPAETWLRCIWGGLLKAENGRISIPQEQRKTA